MTFVAVPQVPQQSNLTDWEVRFLSSIKQNVEILTGQRASGSSALLSGQISVVPVASVNFQQLTANGSGVVISGSSVPLLTDHVKLIVDLANLANDVAAIRSALNTLIRQLNGS